MGKRQAELPNTRRDDEPPPPKTIKELDELCEQFERLKGQAAKKGQEIVAKKGEIDEALRKRGLTWYPYENLKGVECKVFIKNTIATTKLKKAKVDDQADDDGEGGGEE